MTKARVVGTDNRVENVLYMCLLRNSTAMFCTLRNGGEGGSAQPMDIKFMPTNGTMVVSESGPAVAVMRQFAICQLGNTPLMAVK